MAKSAVVDDELKSYPLKNFRGGYNSYTGSKSNLNDDEFPAALNAELDDNGSITKSPGTSRYGGQVSSGFAVTGMGWLKTSVHNKVIVSADTHWYYNNGAGTPAALTGVTFTSNLQTYFIQALSRLYGVNATDTIAYTTNGSTITTQSGGRSGISPVFFNQRIYLIDATTGRIWYSCSYTVTTDVTPDISIGFLGDYGTKLTGTVGVDFKDAGFIELFPGGGVEPTSLTVFGNAIRILTKNHGEWEVSPTTANADKSVAHIVTQKVMHSNTPSPRGACINGADFWWYTGQGLTSYGEVAQYFTARPTTQSGRVRSEMQSVADAMKPLVAMCNFNEKLYVAYSTGTYNDHLIKYDNRLNAYGGPSTGINVSCFLEYVDDTGVRRLLAGSSLSTDSYVYQLETGTDYAGTAISSSFEHKSTDVGLPGRIKYFAFADVFYTLLYGQISYTSYIDENTPISGVQTIGSSGTVSVLGYPQPVGIFPVGYEFLTTVTSTTTATNGDFRIDLEFTPGKRVSTMFSNNNLGEQYKIDRIIYYYQPAESIYQEE